MSRLARVLAVAAMLAAMSLAGMTAAAQAQATDTRAALAQERYYSTWGFGGASTPAPAEPSGQPTWLVIALAVLAAVLALVAGVAVLATHRASRSHHAGQTA